MRIFKTRHFNKWARKEGLLDISLEKAVRELEAGLVDADLGGHVFKKRIPLPGVGKRSGARSILAYKKDNKVMFIFGYAKNVLVNITEEEKMIAKILATEFFSYSEREINLLVNKGELIEVEYVK